MEIYNEDDTDFDVCSGESSKEVSEVTSEDKSYKEEESNEEEYLGEEENLYEENSDEEEYFDEENSEEIIIDKPFNCDQMPKTIGDFAPYFNNITEALFFCWIQKHNICMLNS